MDFEELGKIYQGVTVPTQKTKAKDEAASFVEQRFYAMSYAKQAVREVWQGTENLYYCNDWEWIVKGEGFERAVRFPTLRDFIKTLTDKFMQDPPEIALKPRDYKDPKAADLIIGKKAYIDQRRESIHEKTVRRQIFEDMFFFGKGFRSVNYYDIERDYDGERVTLFNEVGTQRLDPRHQFIDETAVKLHDKTATTGARDYINRIVMPYSGFKQWAEAKGFTNLDAVQPVNFYNVYGLDYIVTNSRELREKSPIWVVMLYEYFNQEQNHYSLTANGSTIYEAPLKKAKGTCKIPISDYTFEARNDSFWGNNLAQLLAPHIYLKDTVFNLDLMNLKLTLQPVIAMSGEFGYNPAVHFLAPGQVWTAGSQMTGKVGDNIQPLVFGNPNTKAMEMLQTVRSEMTITSRADLMSLEYYKKKTATEVVAQNHSMNAHNEYIESVNEIEGEAITYEIFLDVMKSFMNGKDKNGNQRRIKIKDYMVNQREGETPTFVKKSGYESFFDLSDNMINTEVDVEVQDKRSQVARNLEKMGRIMQLLPIVGQLAQFSPEVAQKVDFVGLLSQAIEAIGLDNERSFKDVNDIYDDFEETKQEIFLGHTVDVPEDEERTDSMIRYKYFDDFGQQEERSLTLTQQLALKYHLDSTLKNIMKNHLEIKRAKQKGGMSPATAEVQQEAEVLPPSGGTPQFSQPNPALLNLAGNPSNKIL